MGGVEVAFSGGGEWSGRGGAVWEGVGIFGVEVAMAVPGVFVSIGGGVGAGGVGEDGGIGGVGEMPETLAPELPGVGGGVICGFSGEGFCSGSWVGVRMVREGAVGACVP